MFSYISTRFGWILLMQVMCSFWRKENGPESVAFSLWNDLSVFSVVFFKREKHREASRIQHGWYFPPLKTTCHCNAEFLCWPWLPLKQPK